MLGLALARPSSRTAWLALTSCLTVVGCIDVPNGFKDASSKDEPEAVAAAAPQAVTSGSLSFAVNGITWVDPYAPAVAQGTTQAKVGVAGLSHNYANSYGLVRFATPTNIANATITAASVGFALAVPPNTPGGNNPTVYFYVANAGWTPGVVTWNTKPGFGAYTMGTAVGTGTSVTLTSGSFPTLLTHVQQWSTGALTNNGWLLYESLSGAANAYALRRMSTPTLNVTYTCNSGYAWNGAGCSYIYCNSSTPTNGSVSSSFAWYGNSVSYFCNSGFAVVGASPTCGGTSVPGTWSTSEPSCLQVYCNTTTPLNGSVSSSFAWYGASASYACNAGYALTGTAPTCGGNTRPGTWSGGQPTCTAISCNTSAPLNGSVTSTTAAYGNSVTYNCNAGYVRVGTATATCGGTLNPGTWSSPAATCQLISCNASAPANGSVTAGSAVYGNSVTYSCSAGYALTGTATQTCGGVTNPGTWSATQPSCTPISCNTSAPVNGSVTSNSASWGSSVTYSCNAGYVRVGTAIATCTGTVNPGTWSSVAATCQPISCNASAPTNGSVSPASVAWGSSATYSCNAGYARAGAAPTCGGVANPGTWGSAEPTCTPISCNATAPANGSVSAATAAYGASVTYSCAAGYALSGTTPTCGGVTNPGTWSGAQPTCVTISCNATAPLNGSASPGSATWGNSVSYSCNAGYVRTGSAPTCGGVTNPGTWTGAQPTCTQISCTATAPLNGSASPGSATWGNSVTYSCNAGFAVTGAAPTCGGVLNPGTWTGAQPTCSAISCIATPPTNGSVSAASATFAGSVTWSCNSGWEISANVPSIPLTCGGVTNPGSWSASQPGACVNINECTRTPGVCGVGTCTDSAGSYSCACPGGYLFDGTTCVVTNACLASTPCDPNAACTPIGTMSYSCACNTGYSGSGVTCAPVSSFCPLPPAVSNAAAPAVSGGVGGGSTRSYGAIAAYTCDTGYSKSGADSACGAAGTWSTAPMCVAIAGFCPAAPVVLNAAAAVVGGGAAGGSTTSYQATAAITCDGGYAKAGADPVCGAAGTWSASPSCGAVANYCGAPAAVADATAASVSGGAAGGATNSVGAAASIACNTGFTKAGSDQTCQASGAWTMAPSCVADASYCATNPPVVSNAPAPAVAGGVGGGGTHSFGATAVYSCSTGYAKTGADSTCQASHLWSPAPTCDVIAMFCASAPPTVSNAGAPTVAGGAAGGATQSFGALATYTCGTGYTKSGADASCQANGTWTGGPSCTANPNFCSSAPMSVVNAGAPTISGGAAGGSTSSFGAMASFVCDTGYTKSGGDPACLFDGTWSASPTCLAIPAFCGAPPGPISNGTGPTVSGGVAGGSSASYGATATYVCDLGYSLSGSDPTCQSGGTWSASPTCSVVVSLCGPPPAVANAALASISGGAAGGSTDSLGATAAYACATGFSKSGADATCQPNGSWSLPPTCDAVPDFCGAPPTVTDAATTIVTGGVALGASNSFGATAAYVCTSGYAKSGVDSICQANGAWSTAPVCVETDECALATDNCATDAACTNTPGSFSCSCNPGYAGDGVTCTDQDECALATDDCDGNATCANTPGSFTCTCHSGYSGTGVVCSDVNECLFVLPTLPVCSDNALCTNNVGSYSCACNSGYQGNGSFCIDIDDCTGGGGCGTNEVCVNQLGAPHTCACAAGFTHPTGSPTGTCITACGNGERTVGEDCDDGNTSSGDGCTAACLIERGYACYETASTTSICASTCGDGRIDPPYENCDDGVANSDATPGACRTNCRRDGCGDGVVAAAEECDLGFDNSDTVPDTCRKDCRDPYCGDGVTDYGTGEVCDPGGGDVRPAADCTSSLCHIPDAGVDAGPQPPAPSTCGCRVAGSSESHSPGALSLGFAALVGWLARLRVKRRAHLV